MISVEEYSTGGVSRESKLSFWNELAASTLGPLSVQASGEAPFEGRLCRVRIPNFELVSSRASAGTARSRGDCFDRVALNLTFQHTGMCVSYTNRHSTQMECGDFLLYDPTLALECRFEQPMEQIILRLPYAETADRFPNIESLIGIPIRGKSGPGKLLSSFVLNAWQELRTDPNSEWAGSLEDVIWSMLGLAYESTRVDHVIVDHRLEIYHARMLACIDANLGESEFGTHQLAQELGISSRYVQLLFAKMHTTPSAFILDRRLEAAARLLRQGGARACVTEVAFDVGFAHLSTFCRAFRRKFKVAPREYRLGIRATS